VAAAARFQEVLQGAAAMQRWKQQEVSRRAPWAEKCLATAGKKCLPAAADCGQLHRCLCAGLELLLLLMLMLMLMLPAQLPTALSAFSSVC
jgi:hypothetical protein